MAPHELHALAEDESVTDREDQEEPMGKIVYLVNLNTVDSTNRLSEEIFSADRDNIDRVEWEQKESNTYMYR